MPVPPVHKATYVSEKQENQVQPHYPNALSFEEQKQVLLTMAQSKIQ